jgi:ribonuclease H2 subunit C
MATFICLFGVQVKYTGPSRVGVYFKVHEDTSQPGQRQAAFRGRNLLGRQASLPAGYCGALLQDTKEGSIGETEERRWVQKRRFDKLTYWQHDDAPKGNEPFIKCMRFADLAEVLHGDHSEVTA